MEYKMYEVMSGNMKGPRKTFLGNGYLNEVLRGKAGGWGREECLRYSGERVATQATQVLGIAWSTLCSRQRPAWLDHRE